MISSDQQCGRRASAVARSVGNAEDPLSRGVVMVARDCVSRIVPRTVLLRSTCRAAHTVCADDLA